MSIHEEGREREESITMGQRDGDKCMKVDLQRYHNIPLLTTVNPHTVFISMYERLSLFVHRYCMDGYTIHTPM